MDKQIINKKEIIINDKKIQVKKSDKLSNIRLITFIAALIFDILAFIFKELEIAFAIIGSILLVSFIVLVIIHKKVTNKIKRYDNYLTIIKEYEDRTNDNWKSFKETGIEFIDINKDLFYDLDIVGNNSLFQLVNVAKSIGGKRNLANEFNKVNLTEKEILNRQTTVKELTENFDFNIDFQECLLSYKHIQQNDFSKLTKKLNVNKSSNLFSFILNILFSLISITTLILSLTNVINVSIFLICFLFNFFFSYIVIIVNKQDYNPISDCSRKLSNLKPLFDLINNTSFDSEELIKLQKDINEGKESIDKLANLSSLDSLRVNFISNFIINGLFPLNSLILSNYKKVITDESVNKMNLSIKAIEQLEMLLSLTTIKLIKENSVTPIYTNNTKIDVQGIKHPMLNENVCIANDFISNDDINIITGSNMSGKSSFMKTIAVNLILANCGSNVCATSFTFTFLRMFTSIKVSDDINKNISTFYGELLRIKNIIDYSKEITYPMIVFIDEIFKGTNYNDRIFGAKEIIKLLSTLNCIVIISTHDFELCQIDNKSIYNYHFEERYENGNIIFDYKLLKGQCKTTNARFLINSIGLI